MSELIVIAFDDETRARATFDAVQDLGDRLVIDIAGIAFVHIDEHGKLHLESPDRTSDLATRAATSAVFGTVLGALFFIPLLGLAAGGAIGALFAGLDRTNVDAAFRGRVRAAVPNGHSAVVVYATRVQSDEFDDGLHGSGGDIVRTTLTDSDEQELVREMRAFD
ncbi:Uncharacterized membrane protein [Curtobacterium sp. 314Chir4.1]|uniref:DUF1269 domain-containing protein n=1 Tax=Curtobacterium sp. 314Chir4.1 TaxID=1279028 RepID=UPI000BC5BAB1|nr:DUF1269 domain-containing protein [Curtobacterium sp. 314Chir4.1]SOC88175.1 Uncharacterized membrane protein [Curtobacterium sp. 314Chir4.1]